MTAPELHAHFCRVLSQKLTLSCIRMQTWAEFVSRGYTEEDLDLVIRWTKAQIARGENGFSPLSLQFRVMVQDLDRFEERLALARQKYAGKAWEEKLAAVQPAGVAETPQELSDEAKAAGRAQLEDFKRKLRNPYNPEIETSPAGP